MEQSAKASPTGADGAFSFTGLPPSDASGYSLTEIQPAGYNDGKTTIASGNPGSATSGKPVETSNIDVISGIKLQSGAALTNYLFGETVNLTLKFPIVTGYVWFDSDHSRVRPIDGTQTGESGWTVQLTQNGTPICTVQTDNTGFYQFDNLHCADYSNGLPTGSGFAINFSKNGNALPNVPISGGNQGQVPPTGGQIVGITLTGGEAVVEQDLPLDPAGVVYDSLTRQPIPGATVRITGPAGFDPSTQLVGSTAAQTQVTGADGLYQFLLQNHFPSGTYTLSVTSPSGYLPAPSTALPACNGIANVGLIPNPALVQANNTAPGQSVTPQLNPAGCVGFVAGGARTTQYYFNFNITYGGSAPILNNHIPLDPILVGGLVVTKTTQMENVSVGGLVPYTITVTNTQKVPLNGVDLHDQMPPGFKYRNGSAMRNGIGAPPLVTGRALDWTGQTFAPSEKKTFTVVLAVGTGVGEGEYINQAWAENGLNGGVMSNIAAATVRIVPDPTFDCPDVIGKVFDDKNANGYQDQGELGIPGVRLSTVRGLLVTTDAEGRFHVPCPDIPNADRGSNFVMKLDDRTLPSGYRLTTENPRDIRLTAGKLSKLNFGATIHRVVRVELSDAAFEPGSTKLLPEWQKQIEDLPKELDRQPSVVRIAYARGKDSDGLAGDRVAILRREIRDDWESKDGRYPLMIETRGRRMKFSSPRTLRPARIALIIGTLGIATGGGAWSGRRYSGRCPRQDGRSQRRLAKGSAGEQRTGIQPHRRHAAFGPGNRRTPHDAGSAGAADPARPDRDDGRHARQREFRIRQGGAAAARTPDAGRPGRAPERQRQYPLRNRRPYRQSAHRPGPCARPSRTTRPSPKPALWPLPTI